MKALRIVLMTHGTRGDVQPLVALGREFVRRGHEPVLAVPTGSADMVRAAGLPLEPLPVDWREFLASPSPDRSWVTSSDSEEFLAGLRTVMAAHAADIARTLYQVSEGADLIVSGSLTEDMATVIAEARNIPLALLQLFPVRPNHVVPNPFVTSKSSRIPGANLKTHDAYEHASWEARRDGINRLRGAFGLASTDLSTPQRARMLGALEIQGYSSHLVPGIEWPAHRPFAGWLELEGEDRALAAEHGLDADLESWLDAGDAPAYFGFGSTPVADPAAVMAMIERATGDLGLRAVVTAGWAGLPADAVSDPSRIRVVDSADLSALLPRCRFAVHHGGSGTTGAVIRAGVPALVASGMLDQPMWGELVQRQGVGVHLPLHRLDTDGLRSAMWRLHDPGMVQAARELGEAVRAEGNAVVRATELALAFARTSALPPAADVTAERTAVVSRRSRGVTAPQGRRGGAGKHRGVAA
ncbi:nucleotide disphospho-sugar-binding domain-containing protein [Streptomyces sp. NPDC002896]|uniref:glycosyltransferase n=1 Tax=Streptomyces sp. NPDC002896 TaxID=3154438 RepID=UPI00332B0D8E